MHNPTRLKKLENPPPLNYSQQYRYHCNDKEDMNQPADMEDKKT